MKTTETFTPQQIQLAEWAKALAHPARIAILEVLLRRGACICGDIVDELPLAQATVSQHLKVMKEAGLIRGDIEGRTVCYCADSDQCRQAGQLLRDLLSQSFDCCG
jgi:DNA-binding transcriptional ArsR family regulator